MKWDIDPILKKTKKYVLFELEGDQDQVAAAVVPDIEIRGTRFWFLFCACIIASIGLNTNSAAVIIGAMLISPLMGPILGLGFGLATGSKRITTRAVKNIGFATIISLALSTLYFLISPFQDSTNEIMGRVSPTLLDLFVAVSAAFAGVLTLTSRGSFAIVPGVAIATAIMPPICTAGFGLAHGDFKIAFGAFYLFAVNAVAIAFVAFLLFKRMHFHETEEDIREHRTIPRAAIALALITFIAPLGWTLAVLWKESRVQRQLNQLVKEYRDTFEIVSWRYEGADDPKLTIYVFRNVTSDEIAGFQARLTSVQPKAKAIVRQSADSAETQELVSKLKSSPLYSALSDTSVWTRFLKSSSATTQDSEAVQLSNQLFLSLETELGAVLDGNIKPKFFYRRSSDNTEIALLLETNKRLRGKEKQLVANRLKKWLTARTAHNQLINILWSNENP